MSPPNLLSPLFRTLAREKKSAAARLDAQLAEIRRAAGDALAGGLSILALAAATVQRAVNELGAAHERWIDARLYDEATAWQKLRQPLDAALALTPELEAKTAALLARVESFPA
jgi:hypothetical protein